MQIFFFFQFIVLYRNHSGEWGMFALQSIKKKTQTHEISIWKVWTLINNNSQKNNHLAQ